ncbi:hypothetical protein Noc_0036 [Nitrosococcus oceani ATCC 19707]|uniref:SHOCT domain-containing protein n=2 Tax=Nitrosococcus oceani TaxID=1229 RepID=Q3JF18_NITOC|nr:hypothetical protein [Nitrosococcus oceani]ABA56578.1 hypothetical protein Noc_0036 [Nitrosococcus oceani ATCC 19707]KFI20973.1 hypothetical protein IB75_00110 [Nitrosococcus oceani C-27]
MKSDNCCQFLWLKLSFICFLILCLIACGGDSAIKEEAGGSKEGSILWQAGEQYVRLTSSDGAVGNQHPAAVTPEEMRIVLESLFVPERRFITKKLNPIFSPAEVQVLSTALSQGLALARPNQDITFVSIGTHQGTFAKVRKANTGRVFFRDGKLNIIFGMLHDEVRDQDRQTGEEIDRRLHPFVVGSRLFETKLPNVIALGEGKAFYLDPESGEEREDWLVLDIPTLVTNAKVDPNIPGEQQVDSSLAENIKRSKQETQNLKEDLVKVKEVLFELKEELLELQQGGGYATIEARLQSLKNLYDNELISSDEYRAKRQGLLNEL